VTAGGVTCSGAPLHRQRQWRELPGRVLAWREGNDAKTLEPVPGTASIVAFDAFMRTVVLDDGSTFVLGGKTEAWLPCAASATKEEVMKAKNGPALIAGGTGCGLTWVATAERKLFTWTAAGRTPVATVPIPGDERILAFDAKRGTVVLADGSRYGWAGRWFPLGVLGDSTGVKVRALSGVVLKGGVVFGEGEVRDLPEGDALELMAQRRVEPAS
jgi:hypothetical protein